MKQLEEAKTSMLTILILLILAWQYYIGYSRGLFLQLSYLIGSIVSLFLASLFYKPLGNWFYLWVPYGSPTDGASTYFFDNKYLFSLDKVFYAGLAFFILYLFFYTLVRFLGVFLHLLDLERFNGQIKTRYIAGVLSVLVTWMGIEMMLTVLATIPADVIQDTLSRSLMAKLMINTPVMGQFLQNLWLTQIIG